AAGPDLSPRYFPETGHVVTGRFREVWESGGGLFVFGLPLTSQFPFPSTDGKVYQVQYFERAVFELHPENVAPYDVLLTQVGREWSTTPRMRVPTMPCCWASLAVSAWSAWAFPPVPGSLKRRSLWMGRPRRR